MSRSRLLRFLDELETSAGRAMSLFIPPGLETSEVEGIIEAVPDLREFSPNISESIIGSATGAVLYCGESHRCMVLPPFPIEERRISDGYAIVPLRTLLARDFLIALILVRLGDYAIGMFDREKRLSSKVGTGLVHSRHKKGGSSQRRFERHREKQMEIFFERVCGHAREHLEPHSKQLDYVIYGGERNTLRSFRKQCQFLKAFDERTLPTTLDVRKPRQAALEAAISEVWSSDLTEWIESKG